MVVRSDHIRRDVPGAPTPVLEPQPARRVTEGQWLLEMPFTAPLSLNDRLAWKVRWVKTRPWRKAATELAKQAGIPPCRRITIELFYTPRDDRARDPLNLVASLKAVEDGIVDAGVIPDDSSRYHTSVMPQITRKGPLRPGKNRLWVVITAHP